MSLHLHRQIAVPFLAPLTPTHGWASTPARAATPRAGSARGADDQVKRVFFCQHTPHRRLADMNQADPRAAVRQLAMAAINISPGLAQLHDRGPLGWQDPVQRVAARRQIVEPPGLDACHPHRDWASSQAQCGFPSCRCSATACSVTVARSRSASARASSNSTCSADLPGRAGPGRQRFERALLGGTADRGHSRAVDLPLLGGLPLRALPGQHHHIDLVLLARRQSRLRLRAFTGELDVIISLQNGQTQRSVAGVFSRSNGQLTQTQDRCVGGVAGAGVPFVSRAAALLGAYWSATMGEHVQESLSARQRAPQARTWSHRAACSTQVGPRYPAHTRRQRRGN